MTGDMVLKNQVILYGYRRISKKEVMEKNNTRSYMVRVQDGTIRRNRRDLVALLDTSVEEESSQESELPPQPHEESTGDTTPQSENKLKTRSGRISQPPMRFKQQWN